MELYEEMVRRDKAERDSYIRALLSEKSAELTGNFMSQISEVHTLITESNTDLD